MSAPDIIDACTDPALFAPWFEKPATWRAWFVFLRALFGLPLDADGLALLQQCTGLTEAPPGGVREAWLVVGRRGGKSLILALVAVFLACFKDWSPYLAPGERGVVVVLAVDRRQARVIFGFARAFLTKVPILAPLVANETAEAIELTNGVTLEIMAASYRSVRGHTLVAALGDEIAFWRSEESANPDSEIIGALRPATATVPDAMLLFASSPHARRGALWDAHRTYFGKPGPVMVWKADTRTMNPTVPQRVVDEAYERDPAAAAAEFGGEFRSDVSGFLDRSLVEAAVEPGRAVLAPVEGVRYRAFADPSGGASDSFTLAIAHAEGTAIVLDCLVERRPPFNPSMVVEEMVALARTYRVGEVTGDHYGAGWVVEAFSKAGLTYRHSTRDRSALYLDALPLFTAGRARLLDNARMVTQFAGLERSALAAGRERIDHGPGGHDDLANAAAGAMVLAAQEPQRVPMVAAVVVSRPRNLPGLDGDTRNPALGVGPDGTGGRRSRWDI